MKKLSLIFLMAGSVLVACNTDNRDTARDTSRPGDADYVGVQGQGVESNRDLERTADDWDANTRATMDAERQRVANWTIEDDRFQNNAQSVQTNMTQMEENLKRIEADIQRAMESGNFGDAATSERNESTISLSTDARGKLKNAQDDVNSAREYLQEARQEQQENDFDDASSKLKDANDKLGDAREKYLEALEKHNEDRVDRND
jgi:cellobiose-specific phosphotransferase system component IIA